MNVVMRENYSAKAQNIKNIKALKIKYTGLGFNKS